MGHIRPADVARSLMMGRVAAARPGFACMTSVGMMLLLARSIAINALTDGFALAAQH